MNTTGQSRRSGIRSEIYFGTRDLNSKIKINKNNVFKSRYIVWFLILDDCKIEIN